jgi:hypothetical protein
MSDFNTRGKIPFTVVSSSVKTGYAAGLTASVGQNIDIVDLHRDDYGEIKGSPAQGPFTNQHVGGNQHRHIALNSGSDNAGNRAEAFKISSSVGSIKVYGPEIGSVNNPVASLTRDNTAKSPVNIKNIRTAGNIAGNFENNYQVVQSVGRRTSNNLINDGFEASGTLTTKFVSGSHEVYSLPDITNNSKSIFVERFNAPGGKEESSRGRLDREGEEFSPNNSLTTRNIKARQPFYNQLTQHAAQFNSGSTNKLLPDIGTTDAVTIHGVNRNSRDSFSIEASGSKYDNFWVQHSVPATDLRYKWIAESISSSQQPIQYQSYNLPYSIDSTYNSNGAFSDLEFEQMGPFGDHLGISGAIDKDEMHVSTYTNTMYRDRKYFKLPYFSDPSFFKIDFSNLAKEINQKSFTFSFWFKSGTTTDLASFEILSFSSSLDKTSLYYQNDAIPDTFLILSSFAPGIDRAIWSDSYEISENIENKWKYITISKDTNKFFEKGEVISVYVNAGLVYRQERPNYNFPTEQFQFFNGLIPGGPSEGLSLLDSYADEFSVWNSCLTEEQIAKIFRETKTQYDGIPKKFVEHNFNISGIPSPSHVYSSRIDDELNIMFDEVGNKNASLINFTASVNVYPQNTGLISYSTYFNGPYEGASWKSIRNTEHPVTRKLTTENTNIVSILVPDGPRKVVRSVRGIPVTFQLPGSRKQGKLLNIKESPVYINNKPLKHRFILKDSQNPDIAIETIHTYGNNLQYFANQELNDTLGLLKTDRQMYDLLRDYYTGEVGSVDNPIQKLVGLTYSETIFPKPGTSLLKETRQRTDYITDEPGFGIDGYDRQLGTQRVFWRNNQEDRMRTSSSYITSLGEQIYSVYDLPFMIPSVSALEYISEAKLLSGTIVTDLSYKNSAELNSLALNIYSEIIGESDGGFSTEFYIYENIPASQVPEIYFFKDYLLTSRKFYNSALATASYPDANTRDPSALRVTPKLVFEHATRILASSTHPDPADFTTLSTSASVYVYNTQDLGMNRLTEKISGKNPWYDSYEDFYDDVNSLSKDRITSYSKIPEFIISEQIVDLISAYGGDAAKITLKDYVGGLKIINKNLIDDENKSICEEDNINITINGIKKLLPYNGFYPQDRSIQLVNYLKQSWIDTESIGGGLLLTGSQGENIFRDNSDMLVQYLKQSAFLEPLYSPGIFYNLIKSGIAVDWSVYTGSVPVDNFQITTSEKPQFKVSFESLLNLKDFDISSSLLQEENRFIKFKEFDKTYNADDYLGAAPASSFQGFFEKLKEGSPIYSLCINNFLAETINFFLKDSSLNTFISKPDSEFDIADSNKTYYMDVVLRNNKIVMCEAHSSSLSSNFGKMKGRYFGPSFKTGSTKELNDPSYCAYTPPYYYGDSIARISFKPNLTRKYNISEIFSDMTVENFNTSFLDDSIYLSGSSYSSFVMPIESSVTLRGLIEERQQTVDIAEKNIAFISGVRRNLQKLVGTATSQTGIKRWVISSKMETPILDFSNQEFITSSNFLIPTNGDNDLLAFNPLHTPPTASGFGRGMWSGYGEIPTGDTGIYLQIKESYPRQLVGKFNAAERRFEATDTGSLLKICGFEQANSELSKRIGDLADTREMSEAVVIVPYLDKASSGKTIRFGGGFSTLKVNDTVVIEGHNFIKINQNIFNYQKTNVLSNKPAVSLADFSRGIGSVQETSISRMIGLMDKYVLPPNFDFLLNDSVAPFVIYIAEFTSNLDKQDLADIWQGVMPKIATKAEFEKQVISHKNTQFDFFHGQGLPEDVKFMIFKAKKRAEINYYKMTADSSDDGLFPSIEAGKPPSPYSFNWPYDYCSLVETARVDVEIEYVNKSGSNST